jgi:hypothetical protein
VSPSHLDSHSACGGWWVVSWLVCAHMWYVCLKLQSPWLSLTCACACAVTVPVFQSIAAGLAACAVLAKSVGASVELVDVGVNLSSGPVPLPRQDPKVVVYHGRCANGTRDISVGAAMTAEQLQAAMEQGAGALRRAESAGCQIVCVGEIGIGNTTTAAALLAALTGVAPPLLHLRSCSRLTGSKITPNCDCFQAFLSITGCHIQDLLLLPSHQKIPDQGRAWQLGRR